jgi:predicted nucleic acid-binding protein
MLCDTGPLLALIDPRQPEHHSCRVIFDAAPLPLVSTWACFAEAMHLLRRLGGLRYQQHLWEMQSRGLLTLHSHTQNELARMPVLMERYANVPMDLADASLMSAADFLGDRKLFTLDNDFRIYRFDDGGIFNVTP